jgi:histidinol-phosphate aminotransferase
MRAQSATSAKDVVLGIGLASKATAAEVRALVDQALHDRGIDIDDVCLVATRDRFVLDPRVDLGVPIAGMTDDRLVAASAPCARPFGLQACVAETAALLAAGSRDALLGPVERSAHVTVAVALLRQVGASR